MTGTRAFAVRLGNFVEFRAASQPPKSKVSKLTRHVEVMEEIYHYLDEPPYHKITKQPVKKTITLTQVFYTGGKVVATMTARRYALLAKAVGFPKIGVKGLVELSNVVLDPKWRKEHL